MISILAGVSCKRNNNQHILEIQFLSALQSWIWISEQVSTGGTVCFTLKAKSITLCVCVCVWMLDFLLHLLHVLVNTFVFWCDQLSSFLLNNFLFCLKWAILLVHAFFFFGGGGDRIISEIKLAYRDSIVCGTTDKGSDKIMKTCFISWRVRAKFVYILLNTLGGGG